jgi:hypothetical protein
MGFDIAIPGHLATVSGSVDDADETFTGTFTQDGCSCWRGWYGSWARWRRLRREP